MDSSTSHLTLSANVYPGLLLQKACMPYCKTCNISNDRCLSCPEEKNLIYDPIFFKCICYDQGYDYIVVPYC
jgi:hypothetical protein